MSMLSRRGRCGRALRGGDGDDTMTYNYYSSNTLEGGAGKVNDPNNAAEWLARKIARRVFEFH